MFIYLKLKVTMYTFSMVRSCSHRLLLFTSPDKNGLSRMNTGYYDIKISVDLSPDELKSDHQRFKWSVYSCTSGKEAKHSKRLPTIAFHALDLKWRFPHHSLGLLNSQEKLDLHTCFFTNHNPADHKTAWSINQFMKDVDSGSRCWFKSQVEQ